MTLWNYKLHKTGEAMEARTVHQLTYGHNAQERRAMVIVHVHSGLPKSSWLDLKWDSIKCWLLLYWRVWYFSLKVLFLRLEKLVLVNSLAKETILGLKKECDVCYNLKTSILEMTYWCPLGPWNIYIFCYVRGNLSPESVFHGWIMGKQQCEII